MATRVGAGITWVGTQVLDGVVILVGDGILASVGVAIQVGVGIPAMDGAETSVMVGTIGMETIGDMYNIITLEITVTIQAEEDLVMLIPQTQIEERQAIPEAAPM